MPITSVPAVPNIVGSRWVYKIKVDDAHKARVVVLRLGDGSKGSLRECFRSGESSLKHSYGVGLAAEKTLEVLQSDVPTAFLNSPVDETICMKMMPAREET